MQHATDLFNREKITPDIVGMHSPYELESLGISMSRNMMKLRLECLKYGSSKTEKTKYNIDKFTLDILLDIDFKILDIEKLLQVSERTVYRLMAQLGLQKREFSDIDDDNLDIVVSNIIKDFPRCGEQMLHEILMAKEVKVQRWRLRDWIHRIDLIGTTERKSGRLHRRVYNVMAPNHLWHINM